MSRRRKSGSSVKKSKDDPVDEWTEEEKTSLTDALQRDDGENNWRWIARQVKTKTVTQVKEFASKLNSTKNAVNKRSAPREQQANSASGKRPIAPKDDGPLEGWVNATKRLRGDNDVDGTCIPQNERSRTEEHKDCSGKKADIPVSKDSDNDNVEDFQEEPEANNDLGQQQSVSPSDSCSGKKDSQMNTAMVELLTNQKQMMEKLTLLESKFDNLQSSDASSQSSLMDMLNMINNRLDQIHKSTTHGCCGGPVIIQTTPHASVVHQPILDSWSSCNHKQDDKHKSSLPVSCGESVENKENDSISTSSVSSKPVQTSLNENSSDFHPPTILIPDSQGESLPQSQTVPVASVAPATCISSHLPNVLVAAESSLSGNGHGHSVTAVVSEAERTACTASNQSLPVSNREQLSRVETCNSIAKESSSFPAATRSIVLVVNQSPTITSTANNGLHQLSPSKEQKDVVSECSGTPLAVSQQRFTVLSNSGTRVASVQTTPTTSLQPSYIDLRSTVTSPPVLSSVVRSPTSAAKLTCVGATSDSSPLPQKPTVVAKNMSFAAPLHKSSNENCSMISLHSMTTTASQSSVPPGFISLSHATLSSTPNKIYSMSSLLPQTVRMTSQIPTLKGKELHLSPTAAAVVKKSANSANAKQTAASSKEIMNAAMLISNYVTEHPNREQQAQWQSCLSAIVTDCHKSENQSREEMQQLVSVGYNPYVVLTQFELEDMLEKSKGRPKFFVLRLAEKLFGMDVLIKSTPYGIGGKEALHPAILDAIKVEVLRRFAADMSVEAQTALWKGCVTSIAQRCKRARNPRKNRSFRRVINDEDLGPPSMAVGGGMQHEEREEIEDSHGESDEDDDDDELGSSEKPVAAKNTPPIVRIPSDDDEQESSEKDCRDVVVTTACNKVQCVVTPSKDSSTRLESTGDASVEGSEPEGNKQDIPPGIDPNITVVHLPYSLHSSVEPQCKQVDKVTSPERQNNVVSSGSDSNMGTKPAEESAIVNAVETVSVHEPQECENVGAPQQNSELHGGLFQMAQSIHRLGVFPGSVTVSGIRMTPDYSHVLIGGNPNVALPRQKYLDALTRSSQPTHFAVRLAELAFGDDVLEASTVTGGKRGTLQLDPIVISALQNEVTGRFLKDLSPDQQNVVWRKCVTSIATRCKTLRYNRSKAAENQWTLHQSQDNAEIQSDVTPQENLNS